MQRLDWDEEGMEYEWPEVLSIEPDDDEHIIAQKQDLLAMKLRGVFKERGSWREVEKDKVTHDKSQFWVYLQQLETWHQNIDATIRKWLEKNSKISDV